jgi:hypothetical protein
MSYEVTRERLKVVECESLWRLLHRTVLYQPLVLRPKDGVQVQCWLGRLWDLMIERRER